MTYDPHCIFCKIVRNEIPAAKVFENEHVVAFLDISQVTKGHTLIIPKVHEIDVFDLSEQTARELFAAVPTIANALEDTFSPDGLNIVNNNREAAGQTVFHYHLHLLPRYEEGDGFGVIWKDQSADYSSDDLQNIAKRIRESF